MNRRQFLGAALGAAGTVATGVGLGGYVLPLLAREDLIPGQPPDIVLRPRAWTTTDDRVSFVAIGDNGSGGRQAMAVARQMAETYQRRPYGNVVLLGDISYVVRVEHRLTNVFGLRMGPLLDAGVRFDLAIGTHDEGLRHSDEAFEEIEAEIRLLRTPGRYYSRRLGPVHLFLLDSSRPGLGRKSVV